jgi:hypothetical protein
VSVLVPTSRADPIVLNRVPLARVLKCVVLKEKYFAVGFLVILLKIVEGKHVFIKKGCAKKETLSIGSRDCVLSWPENCEW